MGSNVLGFQNENNLIFNLNGKKISDLNDNLKRFIFFLFGNLNENDIIYAHPGKRGQKPDVIIQVNSDIKNVSVKMGNGNSVHQEDVNLFMNFLSDIGISEKTRLELLKFHWGDGTIDGTGKNRVSSADYKRENRNQIVLINKEINHKEILPQIINRFLFQGKSCEYDIVDSIYYGNSEIGHWAKKEEILNYATSYFFHSDSIHFGPLNYQIWNRCLNFNPNTENRRKVMQVKWASLSQDIINIEKERKNA